VTAGDLTGDGRADLIFGAGPGGAPRVRAADLVQLQAAPGFGTLDDAGVQGAQTANFFAGDTANRGGVRVTVKDLDGDDRADVVTGSGTGAGSRVTGYTGQSLADPNTPPTPVLDFDAFPGFTGGIFVG
jgi:hypothetical protein